MTAPENTVPTRRSQPRLSPEAVRAHTFSRASLGRRGYNEEEVRMFVGRVAEELAASDAEKMSLRSEIQRLRDRFREQQGVVSEAPSERPSAEAINVLSAAQQQADAYIAQAQEYCRQVTSQARQQAEEILNEARSRAEEAAEAAAHDYRAKSGPQYTAELEEMERRVAWMQTFCRAVQLQIQAASDAFAREIGRLGELSLASMNAGPPADGNQAQESTQTREASSAPTDVQQDTTVPRA